MKDFVTANPWGQLRQFTEARIALGRAGVSLPTKQHLQFQLSHAMARDAVHSTLDFPSLKSEIDRLSGNGKETLILSSSATDRQIYLQRPDLGRTLSTDSRLLLKEEVRTESPPDLSLVIGDGLSASAISRNLIPFLEAFLPLLNESGMNFSHPCLVNQCRVALGDEVAFITGASVSVVIIGERPGLSSPDSMGIYMTWSPIPGETKDDKRNCISNIRPGGMTAEEASRKLIYLLQQSFQKRISGVALKDEQDRLLP